MRDWRLPALVAAAYVVARLSGGSLPYFLLYVTAILLATSWLFTQYAVRRVSGLIDVEHPRLEVGDTLQARLRLDNEGLLPIPWLEIDDATPAHLVANDRPRLGTHLALLGSTLIHLNLTARRRGHYQIGPVRVRLGDPLGLFVRELEVRSRAHITIYPRVHPIESLPIPLSHPFGPVRTQERAFEDPSNHAEIRRYVPGDNPRHIHWRTSARMGTLMTRQYELSATTQLLLFLDLNREVQVNRIADGGHSTEETAVEIAASLAAFAVRRKMEAGLICTGQERFAVTPGRGQRTFVEIMEVLARAQAVGGVLLEQLLETETAHLPNRSTLVVITPRLHQRLADQLLQLRVNHRVMLILLDADSFAHPGARAAGAGAPGMPRLASAPLVSLLTLRGIPVYLVPAGADVRGLAEMRVTPGEGVPPWSAHARPQAIS